MFALQPIHLQFPLGDITNLKFNHHNVTKVADTPTQSYGRRSCESTATCGLSPDMDIGSPVPEEPKSYTHDPYNWKCLPDDDFEAALLYRINVARARRVSTATLPVVGFNTHVPVISTSEPSTPLSPVMLNMSLNSFAQPQTSQTSFDEAPTLSKSQQGPTVCTCLVQFKCRQAEYSSPIALQKGQYVVVEGDRGMDIGVVNRVNSDNSKSYVERTGPSGVVMRHATQREVDYWATELKVAEATALEYCRQKIGRGSVVMEVHHAEYQFDKKKLTFYYDAKSRVDFVNLLKDLYREFGCRIWMEKIRTHNE